MKLEIYPDTEQEYQWLYDNGFVDLTWDELEELAWNDRPLPELSYDIEVEFDYEPEGLTRHPYGSTVATEYHSANVDIYEATYMKQTKQVESVDWLEERVEKEL